MPQPIYPYDCFVQAAAGGYSTILRALLLSGADIDESRLEAQGVSRFGFLKIAGEIVYLLCIVGDEARVGYNRRVYLC